jgi:hypothetical protein
MARCAASISSGVWGVLKSEQQECETGVSQFFHNSLSFSWLVFICGFGLQGTRGNLARGYAKSSEKDFSLDSNGQDCL